MPTVWLIRHGESESNANLRTIHPALSHLTPKGLEQAQAIVSSFPEKPALVVVSPFVRAQETAEPTLAHFAPIPHEEWPVHEFTYLAPIHYHHTTGTERGPLAHAYWQRNDPTYKDEGVGESFAELMERIQTTVERLRQNSADFITVFSHGLFLRALLWSVLTGIHEATPDNMRRYSHFVRAVSMPNGAICRAVFSPTAITVSPFDVSHLGQDGVSASGFLV